VPADILNVPASLGSREWENLFGMIKTEKSSSCFEEKFHQFASCVNEEKLRVPSL
jgi:hypothetical protein